MVLRPAPAVSSGIVFRRVDLPASPNRRIEARPDLVIDTRLCTRLGNAAGVEVSTVEHVLAALSLAGVDNAIVDVDGAELPILDGSAGPLIDAINKAGRKTIAAAREALRVMAPIELKDGDRFIRIDPYEGRSLELSIDFADQAIGRRALCVDLDDPACARRIAGARTFCRLADIEAMRSAGLARGGSLDNAIVVDGDKVLNASGLRDPDEFILHKALDLVGDLRLAGPYILGAVTAHKFGHDLNTRFAALLASDRARVERAVVPIEPARVTA
jgi:UDP-3-O-[3-hydroxymyristoyl] N-acetylglucosamine deacetylase